MLRGQRRDRGQAMGGRGGKGDLRLGLRPATADVDSEDSPPNDRNWALRTSTSERMLKHAQLPSEAGGGHCHGAVRQRNQ